jgi:uncharacterized membrane protein YraQ (UPF0718 family)
MPASRQGNRPGNYQGIRMNTILNRHPRSFLVIAAVIWFGIYKILEPLSHILVNALQLEPGSRAYDALQFFLYDTPKVLLLLTGVVMVMGMVNSYFTPERTRALLSGRNEGVGNIMAALLGIVTPFCSCSAVPLFIGFVQAGVPLGVTFSFLISAPMVNEIALALLFALFGWKIAALYLVLGLSIAIVSGYIIGRLRMEAHLEDWVRNMPQVSAAVAGDTLKLTDRINQGFSSVREIVGRVWPYVLAVIAMDSAAADAFHARLRGTFSGILQWQQLDELWARVKIGQWFFCQVGEELPEKSLSGDELAVRIATLDMLLRHDHD